jgi:hypothetical protein
MGKEVQIVEVFLCPHPECGAKNFIEWSKGETQRTIPCIAHHEVIEERTPYLMKVKNRLDDGTFETKNGAYVLVDQECEQVVNKGYPIECIRGQGKDRLQRELNHDLGRDTSWVTTATGVEDPEGVIAHG